MKTIYCTCIAFAVGLLVSGVIAESESSDSADSSAVVSLQQGKLQGIKLTSRKGDPYYGFLGVPFGKVGVRFGTPQEPDSWEGVKSAENNAPLCLQFCLVQTMISGTEDCLTLNVYSRKLEGKAPVLVYFHPGGFQFGSGNWHEAKYLMDEDVVYVAPQYRQGALGFLNMGDDTIPGNNGLRDQSAALKWIQKNIHKFGGDPKRVTISGSSAGGASVHYQMLSPLSKGLFAGAISQSGTALSPWAFQKNPRKYALRLAENVGCMKDTNEEIVDCLRKKPASELLQGQMNLSVYPLAFDLISMLFCPSVEHGSSPDKFLSDTPYKLMERGEIATKVPWIAGTTKDEGALYIAIIVEDEKSIETLNKDYVKMFPNILYFENSADPSDFDKISEKIWKFYIKKDKMTKDDYIAIGRVIGDRFFTSGISSTIRVHAEKNHFPVYPYIFNHIRDHSIVHTFVGAKNIYGVSHGDDIKYFFNSTFGAPEYNLNSDEGKFSENLVKLWVSFARDLKPTATWGPKWEQWKPSNKDDNIPWYDIDTETQILSEDPFKKRTQFWESLPLKEMAKEDVTFDSASKDEL